MVRFRRLTLLFIFVSIVLQAGLALSAPNEYLAYQEPQQPAASSALSTFAYVVSLIITFAAVIALSYIASKFLGKKLGVPGFSGDNRILVSLPLGSNKAIYIVEIAGKFLVLGVTDHNINVLQEITAPEEIEKLKNLTPKQQAMPPFERVFENQLTSLQHMSKKFPAVFRQQTDDTNKEGKR